MHNATEMGLNYTGAKMSPIDSERQVKAAQEVPPDIPGDEQKIALVRSAHIDEAEKIGSVPIP
ncbi:MAG TPA: ferritin Dps family protein, partial [Pseudomonas sp.]|nr:ferritin Dps family protein [Pseudomonas sp.]